MKAKISIGQKVVENGVIEMINNNNTVDIRFLLFTKSNGHKIGKIGKNVLVRYDISYLKPANQDYFPGYDYQLFERTPGDNGIFEKIIESY